MKKIKSLLLISSIFLSACSVIPTAPQATNVLVSPNPAPAGCKYLGQVTGNQGNFFTGGFTSNATLAQGALNDLKNKASALGANYVQIISNNVGTTGSFDQNGGGMQQTNVTNPGNAYNCPPASIGE